MILVVDASVALKWFLHARDDEADSDQALAILSGVHRGDIQLAQPAHFIAEVAAVLAREKPEEAPMDLLDLLEVERLTVDTLETYATALTLAVRHRTHVFYTLYHAVALSTPGVTLVTADQSYWKKARSEGQVTLLADWSAPLRN